MAQSYAPRSGGTRERESGPDVIVCVRALSSQVDLAAVARALKSGHLGGAAVDVYPKEPSRNGTGFETDLHGCPNVILTPHIGTLRARGSVCSQHTLRRDVWARRQADPRRRRSARSASRSQRR